MNFSSYWALCRGCFLMTLIMTVIVPCERLVLNDHHYDGHSFAVYGCVCFAEGQLVTRRPRVDRVLCAEMGVPFQQCMRMRSSIVFLSWAGRPAGRPTRSQVRHRRVYTVYIRLRVCVYCIIRYKYIYCIIHVYCIYFPWATHPPRLFACR